MMSGCCAKRRCDLAAVGAGSAGFAGAERVALIGQGTIGGSCYWNCRRVGFGPWYCRVNAWRFCS
jgi:hypothetical protein